MKTLSILSCLALMLIVSKTSDATTVVARGSGLFPGVMSPVKIAGDSGGTIYVADARKRAVLIFDAGYNLLREVGLPVQPTGLAVLRDGKMLVSQKTAVSIVAGNGAVIGELEATFQGASAIAVAPDGIVYVLDGIAGKVKVFTSGLVLSHEFGTSGGAAGQFALPSGIAYERDRNEVVVADTMNGRVQFFTPAGTHIRTVGSKGTGSDHLTAPRDVAFEYTRDGRVSRMYVVDSFQSTVQVYAAGSSYVYERSLGQHNLQRGEMLNPTGIFYHPLQKQLLVSSNVRERMERFSLQPDVAIPSISILTPPSAISDTSLTLYGTVSEGSEVLMAVSGGAVAGDVAFLGAGAWQCTIHDLPLGVSTVTATARNEAGTGSAVVEVARLTEATKPFLSVVSVPARSMTPSVEVSGMTDSAATISLAFAAAATSATVQRTADSWRAVVAGLAPGPNRITVTAATASGVAKEEISVFYDNGKPYVVTTLPPESARLADRLLTVAGSVQTASLGRVLVNGVMVPVVEGYFATALVMKNGENIISVTATDRSGAETVLTRRLYYDGYQPNCIVETPVTLSTVATGTVEIRGNGTDECGLRANDAAVVVAGGRWQTMIPLVEGVNGLRLVELSATGTTYYHNLPVIWIPGAPEVAFSEVPSDRALRYRNLTTLRAAAAAPVVYYVNGVRASSVQEMMSAIPGEGTYVAAAVARTPAGRTGIAFRTMLVDDTPPGLQMTETAGGHLVGTTDTDATVVVADKSGVLGRATMADGVWTFDLNSLSHDYETVHITALDLAGNRKVAFVHADGNAAERFASADYAIDDAVRALRVAQGLVEPQVGDLVTFDVAPLVDNRSVPDGVIGINDTILILRKIVGLH